MAKLGLVEAGVKAILGQQFLVSRPSPLAMSLFNQTTLIHDQDYIGCQDGA